MTKNERSDTCLTRRSQRYNNDRTTLSVQDHVNFKRDGSLPTNPEWTRQATEAFACWSLEDPFEGGTEGKPLEDLTTEEHFNRISKGDALHEYDHQENAWQGNRPTAVRARQQSGAGLARAARARWHTSEIEQQIVEVEKAYAWQPTTVLHLGRIGPRRST